MSALRFHRSLYSPSALDRAIELFAEHAEFERRDQDPYIEVDIRPKDAGSAELLAGEFGNYVLALSVEESRASR